MESNNKVKIKDILLSFLPLVVMVVCEIAITIIDVLIIFIKNILSVEAIGSFTVEEIMTQDFNQPMNTAYMTLAQYTVFILIFGIWFLKLNKKDNITIAPKVKAFFKNPFMLLLAVAGFMGQIFTDSCMNLLRPMFTDTFDSYDKMVSKSIGANSSFVMIFCVILIAPIAEELLFRGVMLHYQKSGFAIAKNSHRKLFIAIILVLQGIMFGIYHGNIIQGIYAFVFAIILSLVAIETEDILPVVLLHISINISALLIPEILLSTKTGCIISFFVSLVIFAICIFFVIKYKDFKITKNNKKNDEKADVAGEKEN